MKRSLIGSLAALALVSSVALPFAASAGGLDVGVGINLGGGGYYAPPPPVVYSAPPAPVYYEQQPEVVYTAPQVVYGPPAVVYRPYHCWWENGYRVCR